MIDSVRQRTVFVAVLSIVFCRAAWSAGQTNAPEDRFGKSDLPIVYLEQNWTPAESLEFYGLRQGSPIMRRSFFDALEQADGAGLFRDPAYLQRFGFLPQRPHAGNPNGYPIGFSGNESLEIACAACHTSRLTVAGKEYRIDGSQALTDLDSWMAALVRAIKATLADAPELNNTTPSARITLDQGTRFGRFAARILTTATPRVAQVRIVHALLARDLKRRERYNDYNDFGKQFASDAERAAATRHEAYGFGRLDALGAILNQACAETLAIDENAAAANAPVNFPAIWDAPQHTHVQWNGAVDNTARFGPLGRNAGQVIGVFGVLRTEGTFVGYDSSINFDAISRAEELITKLWSPAWPAEFGIDRLQVPQGETVYRANCIACHALMNRTDPNRRANDVLVPISGQFGPNGSLDTDPLTAKNWNERQARIGPLAGRDTTLPFGSEFPNDPNSRVPGREVLTHLVFNVIARSFVPWRDELMLDDAPQRSMVLSMADASNTLMRYKSRPLNGVWSTSPYLHNGSVLNMVELLTAPDRRKPTFRVGSTEFDPATMGFQDAGAFVFDTAKPGNRNTGHAYGTNLPAEQKAALLEFLKTL